MFIYLTMYHTIFTTAEWAKLSTEVGEERYNGTFDPSACVIRARSACSAYTHSGLAPA